MRKLPAFVAALGLVAVSLTGCSLLAVDAETCERVTPGGVAHAVTVAGEPGTVREIDLSTQVSTQQTIFDDAVTGDGRAITAENQMALLAISFFSADTGELIDSNAGDPNSVSPEPLSRWSAQFPGFSAMLECATAGSRIVAALDSEGFGEPNHQGYGLGADEAVVAVVDVIDVYLPRAEGQRQFSAAHGLPSVVRAPDGRPGVSVPASSAPTELRSELLIKGDGDVVADDSVLLLHFMAIDWADSSIVMNTWDTAAGWFTLDSAVAGLGEVLEGQQVGSQLLVVAPPEFAFGDEGGQLGGVPVAAGTTLVFVVDILGIYTPPAP